MKEVRAVGEQALEENGKVFETVIGRIALDTWVERRKMREKQRGETTKSDSRDDDNDDACDANKSYENLVSALVRLLLTLANETVPGPVCEGIFSFADSFFPATEEPVRSEYRQRTDSSTSCNRGNG